MLVDSRVIFSADFKSDGGRKLSVELYAKIQDGRHKTPFLGKCSKNVPKFTITTNQKPRFLMSTFQFWWSTSIMKRFLLVYAAQNE